MRATAPAIALLICCAAPVVRADLPATFGRPVASVDFRGDAEVDRRELAAVTGLAPGVALTELGLRNALRNLFATRRFSDLSVEAAPSDAGVVVVIVFTAAPRITSLKLEGRDIPARGRLLDAIRLAPGDTWSREDGPEVERTVARVLAERGYLEAKAQAVVEAGEDEVSVDVRVRVTPGRRAATGLPIFSAPPRPLTPAQLQKAAKLKLGRPFRERVARDDVARYEALYRKAGRARAEVRYEGVAYDAATATAQARYALYVGPEVRLVVNGAKVSEVKKHADSPWVKEEPPDEEAMKNLAESLRRTYQERGYARARVDVRFETQPDLELIVFTVERGDRISIASVGFEGAASLPPRRLSADLLTRPRGLLTTGRLVDRDLSSDRDSVAVAYRRQGYPDVKVTSGVADGARPYTVDVTFHVDEGAFVTVADRRVEGVQALPLPELTPELLVKPGQPFSSESVQADVGRLQALYADRGYVDARVDGNVSLAPPVPPAPLLATVTYSVFEGTPVAFGRTVVRGNRKTRFKTIRQWFAHQEGKPFSFSKLIDTQQNLSRLNVFSRVELTNFPTDEETRARTVLVTLAEAKPWSVLYGIGAEYDREAEQAFNPRLSLGINYANLFGRAISVGAEGKWSRREKRVILTGRDRSFLDTGVPLTVTVFRSAETRPVELERRGTFVEVEKQLGKRITAVLRYQYEIVRPDESVPDEVLSGLERQNQKINISSLGPGITVDTRDDPVSPHKGMLIAADLKWAFPFLSADARFVKAIGQVALYRKAGAGVLALSLRAGAIEALAACDPVAHPTCPPNLEVPIAERLFAGGRNTHRAFPLDQLGIRGLTLDVKDDGTVIATGGNGLLLGNAEWRVPIKGDLGLSLFLDVGNVWADYRDIKLSQLRPGLGLGLHYLTPVGPLRLEYGRKLDTKPGESTGEVSFSVGYPF